MTNFLLPHLYPHVSKLTTLNAASPWSATLGTLTFYFWFLMLNTANMFLWKHSKSPLKQLILLAVVFNFVAMIFFGTIGFVTAGPMIGLLFMTLKNYDLI